MENIIEFLKNIGIKLGEGLLVSVIGIGVTFVLMILLILFIYLVKYSLLGLSKIFEEKPSQNNKIKEIEPQNVEQNFNSLDPKIIAAISAAVNYYMQAEIGKPKAGFIVKTIRKRV